MTHEHEQGETSQAVTNGEGAPAGGDAVGSDDIASVGAPETSPVEVDVADGAQTGPTQDEPDTLDVPGGSLVGNVQRGERSDTDGSVEAVEPSTRAARRTARRRRRTPAVPALAAAFVLAALSYGGYQTFAAVTGLSLSQGGARAVLAGQTVALLLLAVAGLGAVLLADRRAAIAAKNPTVEALQAALADSERTSAIIAGSRDAAVAVAEDLRTRLNHEEARVEAAVAAVRTAEAVKDQARADLQRYLDERPPSADQIRQQVVEEIAAVQKATLADLHQAHQQVVASLSNRILDAEGAAERAREAAAVAEASVAAERDKTRAEERTRMRITVQALSEADVRATHGQEGAAAVAEFASRFVAAVERLDPGTGGTPPRPVRALASSRAASASDDKAMKKRLGWRN